MTDQWQDSADQKAEIVKVEGVPVPADKPDEAQEFSRRQLFEAFKEFTKSAFGRSVELGKAYVEAKVAQEENQAEKTAKEAAELAAKADKTLAERDIAAQQAAHELTRNLKDICELPEHAQVLAIAKLAQENPDLLKQVEKIRRKLEKLHLTRGTTIQQLPAREPADGR